MHMKHFPSEPNQNIPRSILVALFCYLFFVRHAFFGRSKFFESIFLSGNRPQMIKKMIKPNQLCLSHYALPTRQIAPRTAVSLPEDKNLARRSTVSQVWTHTSWLTCQLWCSTVSRTSCKNTQTSAAAQSHPKNKLCRIQAGWTQSRI